MRIKKFISTIMVLAMVIGSVGFMSTQAHANSPNLTVTVAGHVVNFQGTQPVNQGGHVLVPVRGVFTLMGFYPEWCNDTRTATLFDGLTTIIIPVGQPIFTVNGRVVRPDVPQQIIGGRVLIPLRAITEAIDGSAHWVGETRTAAITPPYEMIERVHLNAITGGPQTRPPALTAPRIITSNFPAGRVGDAYSQTLQATGTTPITWHIHNGSLPVGLNLDTNTGTISGTPSAVGSFNFTIRASSVAGSYTRIFTITIEAQPHFTITFDANGGTGVMQAQIFDPGVSQGLRANTFVRTGYTFMGWRTTRTGTTVQYTDAQSIVATADRTLYAAWSAGYTITFNANGGTGSMPPQIFTRDVAQNLRTNSFTRSGYSFAGWSTTPTGTVQFTDAQRITNNVSRTFYAIWTRGYTVTFNANGGTGTMAPQVFQRDVAQSIRANTFTRTGYSFVGWRTTPTGTTAEFTNSQTITNHVNRTFYAVWSPGYTITFNANGGTGTMAPQVFQRNVAQNLRANAFTRTGYNFAGWSTTPTGARVYNNSQSITNHTSRNLYAIWRSVNLPTITTTSLPGGTVGTAYPSTTLAASGATPITWSQVGNWPPGLTFAANGAITGTPTQAGTFTFIIWASNNHGHDSREFTITIAQGAVVAPTITTPARQTNAISGQHYSNTPILATGTAPITWSATGLPAGITIDPSTGIISGTSTSVGVHHFIVTATNAAGSDSRSGFSLTVSAGSIPHITGSNVHPALVNVPVSFTWTATGTPPIITWSYSGTLPTGMNFANGVLSGTPTATGTFTFTIIATNTVGPNSMTVTITVS